MSENKNTLQNFKKKTVKQSIFFYYNLKQSLKATTVVVI